MEKTTKIRAQKPVLRIIEKAIREGAKRLQKGMAILPLEKDRKLAEQLVAKEKVSKEQKEELVETYLFVLAHVTSIFVSMFENDE